MRASGPKLLITCEHGGNRVPAEYRHLFAGREAALSSHRGFDAGALLMARELARAFATDLVYSTVTRLLVDINRSVGHRHCFSEATAPLPPAQRARIVHRWYQPYRDQVENRVRAAAARGETTVHISSHSFTPVLDGKVRTTEVGLLYDPARPGEIALAKRWQQGIKLTAPSLRVRRNYPYRGANDGLTTYMRRLFPPSTYVGLELEVNHAVMRNDTSEWRPVRSAVIDGLRSALAGTRTSANGGRIRKRP